MTSPKILIIEDDGTLTVSLKRMLRKWGYEAFTADSGETALKIAETECPELALMDIQLEKGMDGITAAKELLSRFDIPCIYLTAFADENFLQRAKETQPYGYLVKPLQELTLRSTLDMALAKRMADRELEKTLKEKEFLMREILHRTKNNMSMICGFLSLQAMYAKDEILLQVFKDIENRVRSMVLIQEKLYCSDDLKHVSLKEYVYDLAYTVFGNLQVNPGKILLRFDGDDITVSTDTAVSCGLIINELLTNALKYAFPENRTGEISIVLRSDDEKNIELRVSDDGVGLPEGFDYRKSDSLGMQLVVMFAEQQLKGNIEINTEQGTDIAIRFCER